MQLGRAVFAFVLFCMAASGTYMVNDVIDAGADRLHPDKRRRPVASGRLKPASAVLAGVVLLGSSLVLAGLLARQSLVLALAAYVAVTMSYALWLKREPVIDLVAVASGFVIRAIAGGLATGVALSDWFLVVASFASLFVVAGKRHSEHVDLGKDRAGHRMTLGQYSLGYLAYVRSVSSAVLITAYCGWAFEKAAAAPASAAWFEVSIVPFVIATLRYALLLDQGQGTAPEEILIADRRVQLLGLAWAVLFALGVYGA